MWIKPMFGIEHTRSQRFGRVPGQHRNAGLGDDRAGIHFQPNEVYGAAVNANAIA